MLNSWFRGYSRGNISMILPIIALYFIWMDRNNFTYNRICRELFLTRCGKLEIWSMLVWSIKKKNFKGNGHVASSFDIHFNSVVITRPSSIIYWLKSDLGFIKLNIDGSIHKNRFDCVGMIRNHSGNLIYAYAIPLHQCSILFIELFSLFLWSQCCSRSWFLENLDWSWCPSCY